MCSPCSVSLWVTWEAWNKVISPALRTFVPLYKTSCSGTRLEGGGMVSWRCCPGVFCVYNQALFSVAREEPCPDLVLCCPAVSSDFLCQTWRNMVFFLCFSRVIFAPNITPCLWPSGSFCVMFWGFLNVLWALFTTESCF